MYFVYLPLSLSMAYYTVCPRSLGPFYIDSYYSKWVKTSLTYSLSPICLFVCFSVCLFLCVCISLSIYGSYTVCPRSLTPFYIDSYYLNLVETSWACISPILYVCLYVFLSACLSLYLWHIILSVQEVSALFT